MKVFTNTKILAVAFGMMVPAVLLCTACGNDDDDIALAPGNSTDVIAPTDYQQSADKGYAITVSVNASRKSSGNSVAKSIAIGNGDFDLLGATYSSETRKLSFSEGDQLFVSGTHPDAGQFAGTLDLVSVANGTFTGTVYVQNATDPETAYNAFFNAAGDNVTATLLPKDYGNYFTITEGYNATLSTTAANAFAVDKKTAVEQLCLEQATGYDNGFALAPKNAILACTVSGLSAGTHTFIVSDGTGEGATSITGSADVSETGVATFAVAFTPETESTSKTYTIKIGNDDTYKIITIGEYAFAANNVYNVNRVAIESNATDLSSIIDAHTAQNGDILTGTLGSTYKISIAAGATVTLKNVTINGIHSDDYQFAGITCVGDAIINIEGTNTVKGFNMNYPGIHVPEGSTLTIQSPSGTGQLTASSGGEDDFAYGCGIGGGYNISCGNIVINSGNITATGGFGAAGIGAGYAASCGSITISGGTVKATGGDYAAGIGAGHAEGNTSQCGDITISGGTVTATGGNEAAGIGGGHAMDGGTSKCESVTITSDVTKVVATKGHDKADCIGKGYVEEGEGTSYVETVTIGGSPIEYSSSSFQRAVRDLGSFDDDKDTWTWEPSSSK